MLLVTIYSVLFHVIMASAEGQQHSWITGFYWTLASWRCRTETR